MVEEKLQACSEPRSSKQKERRNSKARSIATNRHVKEAPPECWMDKSLLDKHHDSNENKYSLKSPKALAPRFQCLSMFMTTNVGNEGAIFCPDPNMQPIFVVEPPYKSELTSQQVHIWFLH